MKRPEKVTIEVLAPPANAHFEATVGRADSLYQRHLRTALQQNRAVRILAADKYLFNQFRTAAKKLCYKLVFCQMNEHVWIKPIAPSEQEMRLLLLLRVPRTREYIEGQKLELNLKVTLANFEADGLIALNKNGGWHLTQQGTEFVQQHGATV